MAGNKGFPKRRRLWTAGILHSQLSRWKPFDQCARFPPKAGAMPALPRELRIRTAAVQSLRRLRKRGCRLPVSRILSTPVLPGAGRSFLSIPLARNAPLARGATNTREFDGRAALSLLCLAPPGVCTAAPVALGAVGSYPTISPLPPDWPGAVSFCCTFHPGPSRFPSLAFTRRVALRCPDFPQPRLAPRLRPPGRRRGSKH